MGTCYFGTTEKLLCERLRARYRDGVYFNLGVDLNVAHPAGTARSYTRSRRGKIGVDAYLSPEDWAALHPISAERGMALCWLATEAIKALITRHSAGAEPSEARAP